MHFCIVAKRIVRLFNDDKFSFLRDALDAMMKESASDGLGLTKKQGEVITLDEEEQLWSKGFSEIRTLNNCLTPLCICLEFTLL